MFLRAKRMAASAKLSEVSSTRPFGDHADHASHGGHHGGTPLAGGDGYIPTADRVHLRPDEQHAQRYDEEGHEFEDGVDALVEVLDACSL